jgi:hypothetical protein
MSESGTSAGREGQQAFQESELLRAELQAPPGAEKGPGDSGLVSCDRFEDRGPRRELIGTHLSFQTAATVR